MYPFDEQKCRVTLALNTIASRQHLQLVAAKQATYCGNEEICHASQALRVTDYKVLKVIRLLSTFVTPFLI